ncbi:MAG: hypothetical protein M3552_20405 [Planctomycetota bacterium]|nr:hypothetical protein [Planctomycetaceae bacterium]MDQ3332980.1 hypothetical protein [Planctomycetota bacterium]
MSENPANGYWLIEPEELSHLMATSRLHPLAETVLAWLAAEVSNRLDLDSCAVQIHVIHAQYLGGPYPCLGVQAKEIPPALERRIEQEITRLLQQTPLSAFLQNVTAA